MQPYILTLHILAATIWTGGHLILATVILPKILKKRDVKGLMDFEMSYEKIGMPALIIQVITGFYLVYNMVPDISKWFSFSDFTTTRIGIKLILLITTVLFALSAKLFVIPKLSKKTLPLMAFHIISVTTIGIAFVIIGSSFKNDLF
jgi:putative copper export protein